MSRRTYSKPSLRKLGSVRDVTRGSVTGQPG